MAKSDSDDGRVEVALVDDPTARLRVLPIEFDPARHIRLEALPKKSKKRSKRSGSKG